MYINKTYFDNKKPPKYYIITDDKNEFQVRSMYFNNELIYSYGPSNIPCTSITCSPSIDVLNTNISPEQGGGVNVNLQVFPEDTTDEITYTIHNPDICYIQKNDDGYFVFANGIYATGATVITFKCGDVSVDCLVTIIYE